MTQDKIKVLVADDNKLLLAITRDALENAGFEVFTVDSGLDVYQEVVNYKPHLILLDIMMPEIDGIEICRTLKQNPATRKMVIIMYSAKRDMELMDLCYEAGAEGFLLKSDQIEKMVERIKEVVQDKFLTC